MDRPTAYDLMANFDQSEKCQIHEISFRVGRYLGVVVGKNSTFRERAAINLIWMHETGIILKHKRFWEKPKPLCTSKSEIFRSVSFSDIGAIVIVLLTVIGLSIIVLIGENINYNYKKRKFKIREKIHLKINA